MGWSISLQGHPGLRISWAFSISENATKTSQTEYPATEEMLY
jgi:hypothetical protein